MTCDLERRRKHGCWWLFATLALAVACTPETPSPEQAPAPPTGETGNGQAIDLIIEGDYVVTMDSEATVI